MDRVPPQRQTAWFFSLSLSLSWALGVLWLHRQEDSQLIQWMMVTPAIVGFGCAWVFEREAPRAVGLAFTGWRPWIVAVFYPLAFEGVAVLLGYAVRLLTGRPAFIVFHPERLLFNGLAPLLGWLGTMLATAIAPWLVVALLYRFAVPSGRARRWRPLGSLFELATWVFLVLLYPGPLGPPGVLGEEVGWRGFLVRRWKHSPRAALLIGAPIWAAFHLPIIFGDAQRGDVALNVSFLASIAAAAPVFAALYLWSRSIWPCVVLHFTWNLFNPLILGDVYHGRGGAFGGAVWFFNGEGVCGVLINGALSAWLVLGALRLPQFSNDDASAFGHAATGVASS